MRRLLIMTALLASMSCASSGSIGEMRMFMQPRSEVWQAAVVAMHDVGARILVSNRSSGMLAGDVTRGELGGRVRLDVTVRSSSQTQDGIRSGSDLSVGVTYEGGMPDDPFLQVELKDLKDQYLDAVEHNLMMVRGYGRGIR
ncbi:MAG: hypothetical protein DRJ61_10765 [Acidobacteria bacterium]|nr:MAG: hypothetical protein DRJ61_10765 [Acidobacteriota bacterium]